jgi:cell shape-determining protein MreC
MSYLYVSKKKSPKAGNGLWIGVVLVIAIIVMVIFFRSSFFSVMTSWWRGESNVIQAAGVATSWFGDKAELSQKIETLEQKNADLTAQLAMYRAKNIAYDDLVGELKETEVEIITTTVEIASTTGSSTQVTTTAPVIPDIKVDGLLSKIVRRPPFTIFDTYVVDKGTRDGVNVGDLAYAHGVPVGTVKSVTATNAVVSLYSSPDEKILVTFGTTSLQYEAYGIGNGALKSDVPRDAEIAEGIEVTAGDREVSVLGIVVAIDKESNATNKTVFISLPFDISETDWLVIKTK